MKQLIRSLSWSLLILGALELPAQTTEYFSAEPGIGYTQLVDEPFSPLLHTGTSVHLALGNRYEKLRSEWLVNFQGGFGNLSAKVSDRGEYATSSVTTYLFGLELNNYRLLRNVGKGSIWLGGAWNTHFDLRMYELLSNNVAGFEVRSTLDFGAFYRYELNQRHRLQTGLQIPLIGAASRPSYIGAVEFEEDLDLDLLGMLLPDELVSLHNLRVIQTHIQWRWIQKNDHQLYFTYRWQGGVNNQTRQLAFGRHQLGVAYCFLTKKPTS